MNTGKSLLQVPAWTRWRIAAGTEIIRIWLNYSHSAPSNNLLGWWRRTIWRRAAWTATRRSLLAFPLAFKFFEFLFFTALCYVSELLFLLLLVQLLQRCHEIFFLLAAWRLFTCNNWLSAGIGDEVVATLKCQMAGELKQNKNLMRRQKVNKQIVS